MRLWLALDQRGHAGLDGGPGGLVVLGLGVQIVQPQAGQHQRVELGLNRSQRDETAIGTRIGVVERRIVKRAGLCTVDLSARTYPLRERAQHGHDVHNGRIHHPPWATGTHRQQCAGDAERQTQRPARVAHHGGWDHGRLPVATGQRQQPGERHIVQVVPGRLGQWPALAPAGHAPVHQPGVAGCARLRPQPQALHHTGAVALDQGIGSGNQIHRPRHPLRCFQVHGFDVFAPAQRVAGTTGQPVHGHRRPWPNQRGDLGTQIGQHHRGQRAGADALELHHAHPIQRLVERRCGGAHSALAIRSFITSLAPP